MKATIIFNPYPQTKPSNTTNYIVLLGSGLTDSYWYDEMDGEWLDNEHSKLPIEGVIGWAEFPEVELKTQ